MTEQLYFYCDNVTRFIPVHIALCEDDSIRILIGDDDEYYTGETAGEIYIADSLAAGRIELCHQGLWRMLCKKSWSREDAAVACHQLGFSRAGKCAVFKSL